MVENSGIILGVPEISLNELRFSFIRIEDLAKAQRFEVRTRQITGDRGIVEIEERNKSVAAKQPVDVHKQLGQIVDLSALTPGTPFGDAIDQLRHSVKPPLNIVVLWRDLNDKSDIDRTTPINMQGVSAIRLGNALRLLLKSASGSSGQLGYIVEDGVVFIATRESLPETSETRVYDIDSLISSPANFR